MDHETGRWEEGDDEELDAEMSGEAENRLYRVEQAGQRLDSWLAAQAGLSRSRVQKLIADGAVWVDGQTVPARFLLKQGQEVRLQLPRPQEYHLVPEDIPLDIVYEDGDIVVVNKQQGMVVHPAAGNWSGTLVHALLYHCRDMGSIAGTVRPGIVHRLDKDTSGLMVVAKNEAAMAALSEQIQQRRVERCYKALVWGGFREDEGTIELPIGRHPRERKKMAIVADGRPSRTDYRVEERFGRWTLLRLKLHTGRTHQIRVHLSRMQHPIVGDPLYGSGDNPFGLKAQALHAYRLCLKHPRSGEYLCWQSDLPEQFAKVLARLHHLET